MNDITSKIDETIYNNSEYEHLLEGIIDDEQDFNEQELGKVNELLSLECEDDMDDELDNEELEKENITEENYTETSIKDSNTKNVKDTRFVVDISEDKLSAYVKINSSDDGEKVTEKDIYDALNYKNIKFGIDYDKIKELYNNPVYEEFVLIAKGEPEENGKNGKLTFEFDVKNQRKPKILDDGRVDYKNLSYIESIKASGVLCTATLPVAGKNGKNVHGNEIIAIDGKEAVLPKGKNVEISEDGLKLIASVDGCVEYAMGKMNVYKQLDIPDNIDASTGNIKFAGNIDIKGDVLSGFKVQAEGSIFINGLVEAATIEAGGDVLVKKGIVGRGKAVIKSGNNVTSKYIENASVIAKKNIQAEAIMHSDTKAGKKVELLGRKALLVGGQCGAGKEVVAGTIGSEMGTSTQIDVGLDPDVRERYFEIKNIIANKEENIISLSKAAITLNKLKQIKKINDEKIERLNKILETIRSLNKEVENLNIEYKDIQELFSLTANGVVKVNHKIFPGTRISVGEPIYIVRDLMRTTIFKRKGADIIAQSI